MKYKATEDLTEQYYHMLCEMKTLSQAFF